MNEAEIKIVSSQEELADAKEVRRKVFQEEQNIDPKLDFDERDGEADHAIAYVEKIPVGTARVRYLDENKEIAKIERVAVLKAYRGIKIGHMIMDHLHKYLSEKGVKETTLESQEHAKEFYKKLGYKQKGESFEEVGISHVKMEKKI